MLRLISICTLSMIILCNLGCSDKKGVELPKDTKAIVASTNPVQK